MKKELTKFLRNYLIQFVGLKPGKHGFSFDAGEMFFEAFEHPEVSNGDVQVDLVLDKQSSMLVLEFELNGIVNVLCDRCGDPLDQPVQGDFRLIVKFGDGEFEQTDEIIILPHGEHEINVAKYIYEFIILALPQRRIHPEGQCNEEAIKRIESYGKGNDEPPTDPRWEALKGLK